MGLAAARGRLDRATVQAAAEETTRLTSMVVLLLIGSTAFFDLERGFHSEELEMLPEELASGGAVFDADELAIEEEA